MTIIDLTVAPTSARKNVLSSDDAFTARTGTKQVQGHSGSRWQFALTWTNLHDNDLRALRGIHARLQGMRNQLRVSLATVTSYARNGTGANTPTVNGAHSAGATALAVDNLTLSTSGLWTAGDFVSVGEQLLQLGEPYDSDGSGEAIIDIWPPLHSNLAGGESVEQDDPSGVFFLVEDSGFDLVPAFGQLSTSIVWTLEEDVLA